MRKLSFLSCLIFLCSWQLCVYAQTRTVLNFNKGWKFSNTDDSNAKHLNYNDSKWRNVDLPHDWSIESSFSDQYPATNQGGALPGGISWYRKTFSMPASAKSKLTRIVFDGV